MFNKNLTYFVIPLVFGFCLSLSPDDFRYEAYPIESCADNSSYSGYCVDCVTAQDCNNGKEVETHDCSDNTKACRTLKYFAACSDLSKVPDCSCPSGTTIKKPDPYDQQKYLLCINGNRHSYSCPKDEYFNPNTKQCDAITTTTVMTTTDSGCSGDENEIIKTNCTCFRYCFEGDSSYYDVCCDPGEIYNNVTERCEFFYLFNCTDKEDGRYVDTHNCSIYYLCVDDEIFATNNCPVGESFDEEKKSCSPGATCNEVPDCGICPDSGSFIKVDCNYYYCIKNKASKDPPYVPELHTCPVGTCFSDETHYCEIDPKTF